MSEVEGMQIMYYINIQNDFFFVSKQMEVEFEVSFSLTSFI